MTDTLPYNGLPQSSKASHRAEPKSAERVENAGPVRANYDEKQQQPTPPETPAERSGQNKHLAEEVLTEETVNDLKKKSLNNVGVSQKPKLQGENQIEDDDGKVPTPKSGGKLEDMKEETESPEATIKRMQERMSFFEKELRHSGILTKSDDGLSVDTSPIRHDKNGKAESKSKRQPAIPKLQYVEWEEFKHKYADDNKVYAVEVLTGEARYYYQKEEDLKNIKMGRSTTSKVQAEVAEKIEPPSTNLKSFKELPERIRINSEPILEILGQIDSEDEWRPYIMRKVVLRPYKPLVFYEQQIREAYDKLLNKWGEAEKLKDAEDASGIEKSTQIRVMEAQNKGYDQARDLKKTTTDKEQVTSSSIDNVEFSSAERERSSLSPSRGNFVADGNGDLSSIATKTKDQLDEEQRQTERVAAALPDEAKSDTDIGGAEMKATSQSAGEAQAKPDSPPNLTNGTDKSNDINTSKEESTPDDDARTKVSAKEHEEDESKEEQEDLTDCVEALRDLRCLIEFMDNDLQPVVERMKSPATQKVYFSDLWHLFKPGDLLYAPLGSKSESEVAVEITGKVYNKKPGDRTQDLWKIMSTADGRPNLRTKQETDNDNVPAYKRINGFIVLSSYVDFNGSRFGAITYQHTIPAYKGERDITSLVFYPLKFARNQEELKSKWLQRGKNFKEYTTPKHRYYTGRSLTCRPTGLRPPEEDFPKHAESIDSQVVVDFAEGLAANPDWGPIFGVSTMMNPLFREFNEDYPVTVWKDRTRKTIEDSKSDHFYFDQRIDEKAMRVHQENDPLTKDIPDKNVEDNGELSDETLMLLPNRVFAFVMKNRKFAILTVDGMRDIKPYRDGFKDLKLPGKHKTMVSSLVHNHFHNKKAEISDREASHDADIVRGKGKGLIVLLHGAPGVGKTSTAETVAEAYRKPLFPITCGDLGLTASEVETELEEKFHLAELWDCVLLLDEADVFLAQRTRTDVKRNSLVSVFLRVLEYFTGILFLTTNRVGAFDEAFKSRIHISLYYPPLDWNQTEAIWEMNMGKLRDKKRRRNEKFKVDEERLYRFARQHYKENRPKNAHWNGRQIRNAFQTATALAEFEAHEAAQNEKKKAREGVELSLFEPELKVEHFETVAIASSEFDDYLYKLRGKTDSSRAFFDQERADQYQPAQKHFTRKAQQPVQAYQGMPPPPLPMQQAQAPRSARPYQQSSRQQNPYLENRQMYSMTPSLHDDALSEEDEDLKYGQSWQEPPSAFPQPDYPEDGDLWRREASPQRQQPRNFSAIRKGSYLGYSSSGARDE